MTRSIVQLPREARDAYDVYVNGVLQQAGVDYEEEGTSLVFDRPLRTDRVTGRRWLLGAWGIGTYRQDDTVDIRYEVDGEIRLKHRAAITLEPDP